MEKHVRSILTKLNLPESETEHRRVMAVLLVSRRPLRGLLRALLRALRLAGVPLIPAGR